MKYIRPFNEMYENLDASKAIDDIFSQFIDYLEMRSKDTDELKLKYFKQWSMILQKPSNSIIVYCLDPNVYQLGDMVNPKFPYFEFRQYTETELELRFSSFGFDYGLLHFYISDLVSRYAESGSSSLKYVYDTEIFDFLYDTIVCHLLIKIGDYIVQCYSPPTTSLYVRRAPRSNNSKIEDFLKNLRDSGSNEYFIKALELILEFFETGEIPKFNSKTMTRDFKLFVLIKDNFHSKDLGEVIDNMQLYTDEFLQILKSRNSNVFQYLVNKSYSAAKLNYVRTNLPTLYNSIKANKGKDAWGTDLQADAGEYGL